MKHTPVEVEVMVPCAEGREHPVRLRIHSWNKWELAYTPCEDLLGRGFALMAPCAAYVRERNVALESVVLQAMATQGESGLAFVAQAARSGRTVELRQRAVEALGAAQSEQAVYALQKVLQDKSSTVRSAAAEALGKLGDAQAVPALQKALSDHSEYVRQAAQEALNQIRARQQAQTEGDRQ